MKDQLRRPELVPGGLGYRSSVQLPGWAFPIHVVGLDTAWLCGDDADAGRLLLTDNQIGTHVTDEKGGTLPGLRIVLMHHPLQDIADRIPAQRLLARHADLILRGHLHQTEVVEWIDPDTRLGELAAGSLYEGGLADTYGNSCQFVRLELDSAMRPIEATVRFRSFSPRGGHWFDDNGIYRSSQNGRITWTFGTAPAVKKPNPFSPWTPRPEQCFGRTGIFKRLENAFDERRSMWLVGDWRIGKTMILQAWEKRLRERGVVVKLVSGQGPAGVSPAHFVETVTGLDSPAGADDAADRLLSWINAVSSGIPPVVLVDKVESVVQSCDVRFFDRLRDLLGRICLVFSSRDAPDEVFTSHSHSESFYVNFEILDIRCASRRKKLQWV